MTPSAVSEQENSSFALERLSRVTSNQEAVTAPIDLYEAMARALKYNLDVKVEVAQQALRVDEVSLANYEMLPGLVARSGFAGRDKADPSSASTRDPDVVDADLAFSWSILDFGLSYVRAKQAASEVQIQAETRRKVTSRLIEDVRTAYWRAASYQRLVGRLHALENRVTRALRESRQISGSGESSPLVALAYERELLSIKGEIETLENEMLRAKTQLSALMNVTPGTKFSVGTASRSSANIALPSDLHKLYSMAVVNRPEMRELLYKLKINEQELNAALLKLLPNFNIYAGINYDSNEFIQPNDWFSWGGKVTWNLLKLVALPATQRKIAAQEETIEARALSVAMAIMTQVQISRIRYAHLSKRYRTSSALSSVTGKILGQVKAQAASDRATQQNLIREEMNALLADAKQDMAYADLQSALANIYASIGLDPLPAGFDTDGATVESIAKTLQSTWKGNSAMPSAQLVRAD